MNTGTSVVFPWSAPGRVQTVVLGTLVLIGLAGWEFLINEPAALFAYALLDLIGCAVLLGRRIIRNEFTILFVALGLLYTYSFTAEALTGLADPQSFTIVINLSALGLDLIPDSSAILLASILFRCAILLGWGGDVQGRSRLVPALTRIDSVDLILVALLGLAAFVLAHGTGISIVLLLARNLFICFVTMCCLIAARRFQFRLLPALVIMLTAAVGLLLIDRSRLPVMVIALSLSMVCFSKVNLRRWQLLLAGVVILGIFVSVGYFRDTAGDRGDRSGAGILSQEETGTIHLVGAHVIGLASRGGLPSELSESVVDKLRRAIPGAGEAMLADRYVWNFFPEAAANGGGFAYPAVAEWFVLGGAVGVVAAGLALGALIGVLTRGIGSAYSASLVTVFLGQFFRQELSVSLLTVLTLVAGSLALQTLRQILASVAPADGKPIGRAAQ